MVTWTWTAVLSNALNITSSTASRVATVCTESLPRQPVPLSPDPDETNVTTYGALSYSVSVILVELTFTWNAMDSINDFGKVCDAFQTVAEIQLYLSTNATNNFTMIHHGIPSKTSYTMPEDDSTHFLRTYFHH